jgi:hypothetical protein
MYLPGFVRNGVLLPLIRQFLPCLQNFNQLTAAPYALLPFFGKLVLAECPSKTIVSWRSKIKYIRPSGTFSGIIVIRWPGAGKP